MLRDTPLIITDWTNKPEADEEIITFPKSNPHTHAFFPVKIFLLMKVEFNSTRKWYLHY